MAAVKLESIVCDGCQSDDCEFLLYVGDEDSMYIDKIGNVTQNYSSHDYESVKDVLEKNFQMEDYDIYASCNECEDETRASFHFSDGVTLNDETEAFKKSFI